MARFPKLIYIFNIIPTEIPAGFFAEINKLILIYVRKFKESRLTKTILKDKMSGFICSYFKTYYKSTVTKIVWYRQKDRHIDQWNRMEKPEIIPYIYVQMNLFFSFLRSYLQHMGKKVPRLAVNIIRGLRILLQKQYTEFREQVNKKMRGNSKLGWEKNGVGGKTSPTFKKNYPTQLYSTCPFIHLFIHLENAYQAQTMCHRLVETGEQDKPVSASCSWPPAPALQSHELIPAGIKFWKTQSRCAFRSAEPVHMPSQPW